MSKFLKFCRDWRTTIFGSGGGVAGAIALLNPKYQAIAAPAFALCVALFSYFVKDKEATGGTVPMTVEAEKRVTPEAAAPSKK